METKTRISAPKIVLRIVGFALFFAFVLQLAGFWLLPRTGIGLFGSYTGGGVYAEAKDTVDVVALGSSDVCCGVTPLEWYSDCGFTGYTVGKSWASACDVYFMLRRLYQTQSPKAVIVCTDILYDKFNNNDDVEYTTMRTLANFFPAIYFHDNWKTPEQTSGFSGIDLSQTDPTKGYYFSTECEQLQVDPAYMGSGAGFEPIPTLQGWYLDAILRLCAQHGSTVILSTIPNDSWTMEKHNAVARYAAAHGLAYLDYNVEPTSPALVWDEDTFNYCHMNLSGAVKVTAAMEAYLTAHLSLPDHRGDTAYAAWDADLALYEQQKATPAQKDA
ncbi:MAG: hypothetical protein LKJ90_08815 [Faecalibacterium sp.]|nr:hypothetical protein [Faecalibacterium sp.]